MSSSEVTGYLIQHCASKDEVAHIGSFNFVLSQFIYLISIFSTFVSTYFAIKIVQTKSIFQNSTKILIYQNLFSCNLHQMIYGMSSVQRLYKAFFQITDLCLPLKSEADCVLYHLMFIAGICGMIFGQTGLLLERACASFMEHYEKNKRLLIGVSIVLVVLILSALTERIAIWDDPLDGYLLTCASWPARSTERSKMFYSVITIISLFNLIISIVINKYNKKLEYSTPFLVGPRFQKREMIESTSTICFLTFTQLALMFIYSFGIFLMKTFRDMLTYEQYNGIIIWLYTIPFLATLFPILLIYRIRRSRLRRVQIIKSFTNAKQTQEDHIRQINDIWK